MTDENNDLTYPVSPRLEVNGIPYLARMCDKIRLHAKGELHVDYHPNLGGGYDKWACEFLGIEYADLVVKVNEGLADEDVLKWAVSSGGERTEQERDWWISYMQNRGFKDDLAEILNERKEEAGFADRDDICSFFDYIDADEGRM